MNAARAWNVPGFAKLILAIWPGCLLTKCPRRPGERRFIALSVIEACRIPHDGDEHSALSASSKLLTLHKFFLRL
jgi:hypothetical protein